MILDADIAFSIRDLIYFVSAVGGGVALWFGLKAKVMEALTKAESAMETSTEALEKATKLEIDLLKNYPTNNAMEAVERRLSGQLANVEAMVRSINDFLRGKPSGE